MLGFTYSQADDSAESVIWTECVLGQGYELLRDAERSAGTRTGAVTCTREHTQTVIRLGNRPVFAFSARIADVGVARAASDAVSITRVIGVAGSMATPFIAFRIARSRYAAVVLWKPGTNLHAADGKSMLIVAPPGGNAIGILRDCSFLTSSLRRKLPFVGAREVSQSWYDLAGATHPESEVLVLAAQIAEPSAERSDVLFKKAQWTFGSLEVIDVSAMLKKSIADGLEVSSERHRTLTRLTSRIRIPSSARSRAQAG